MKPVCIFLLSITCFWGKSQTKDISVFYSANRFLRNDFSLNSTKVIGAQYLFISKEKFSFGGVASYGSSSVSYNGMQWRYLPQVQGPSNFNRDFIESISAQKSYVGIGLVGYYQVFKKGRFTIAPGIKASVAHYIKSQATYTTVFVNRYGEADTISVSHATNNDGHLRDYPVGILSTHVTVKFQCMISKKLALLCEPVVGINKYKFSSRLIYNAGINIGLSWKW